ncbi:MAG: tRNA (5-methylaminomethyl-2-thiouridylate)-methyltransferase (EC 2.1.1.61) [Olavius algarvensis Delta 4 endosymbiont]|nr:MAG: tRNA (5-methylaminomethyl-2-thiouridylate)-methyltransferase (EC 2.1.1.61) [Olavius algarvensis Delta 4 endosymbiont]
MAPDKKKVSALGLCSGGLDSILAALVLRNQGIEVEWITFETPFFSADKARRAARLNDIPITVKRILPTYLEMLKNPPAGYGKQMNPCMDCHALMFRLAGEEMQSRGFDFLFSGEVSGQRPMSQNKNSLRYVEKNSGYDGAIVRPLSAQNLPVTRPEKEGLVDRDQLLNFSGRSRKPQLELADRWGVKDFPSPAGGCLLTEKGYATRLRDLFNYQDTYRDAEFYLLSCGRHLRLNADHKLIVGRSKVENEKIEALIDPDMDVEFRVENCPGPVSLVPNGCDEATAKQAAAICAGYSKAPAGDPAEVLVIQGDRQTTLTVMPTPPRDNKPFLL